MSHLKQGDKIWNGDCYWTVVAIVKDAIGFTTPTGHKIIWYEKKYATDLFNYQLKQAKP